MAKLPKKYPTNRLRHDDLLGGARHADV
jgi:hypothetical protein